MTRLLIVDDHAAFRQALAFVLEREEGVTEVRQAGTLTEARDHLAGVDVAILDLDLPDGNGMSLIHPLRAANPGGAVLILTGSADKVQVARAVQLGASGVMRKTSPVADIVRAVHRLRSGESILTPREAAALQEAAFETQEESREVQERLALLTPRERDVLEALALGLGDREIAERLNVGHETVRTHMAKILSKLEVESRLQALVFAAQHGAVKIG